jgi:hypothetical protein
MSEKTLAELVEIRREIDTWRAYKHEQQPWIAMFDARIRRAEAAERAIEAWLAWSDSSNVNGKWDAFAIHVTDYVAAREAVWTDYMAAREAVRKMEEGT